MKRAFTALLISLPFILLGGVRPDQAQKVINSDSSNFEVYSEIGGDLKRVNLHDLKRYYIQEVNRTEIPYVPSATGNALNKIQLEKDPNAAIWYIDSEGDANILYTSMTGDLADEADTGNVYERVIIDQLLVAKADTGSIVNTGVEDLDFESPAMSVTHIITKGGDTITININDIYDAGNFVNADLNIDSTLQITEYFGSNERYIVNRFTGSVGVAFDGIVRGRVDTGDVRVFVVDSVEEIPSLSASLGDLIYRNGGGLYEVASDTIEGYDIDNIAVIPIGANYAVLSDKQIDTDFLPIQSAISFAQATGKSIRITGTVNASGSNLNFQDLDIYFSVGGLVIADTILGEGATVHAGRRQIWGSSTAIRGNWSNTEGYIEWTTGSSFSDSIANLNGWINIIEMTATTLLPADTVKVHLKANRSYETQSTKPVIVRGLRDSSVLILHGYKLTPSVAIFRPNSCSFKDFTILSQEYIDGITNYDNQHIIAGGGYHPTDNPDFRGSAEYLTLENVRVLGNISIFQVNYRDANFSDTSDFLKNSNSNLEVTISNSYFEGFIVSLALVNCGYNLIKIENSQFRNFSEAGINGSVSGFATTEYFTAINNNRGDVIINNCNYTNENAIAGAVGRTMAPLTIKGGYGNLFFTNNVVEGLQTVNGSADNFYWTGYGRATVDNCKFRNILNGGTTYINQLVKNRGVEEYYISNSEFIIEPIAFLNVGIIDSINQDFSTLGTADVRLSFSEVGTDEFRKKYNISNCYFSTPILNIATEIRDANSFNFQNNTVSIGFFGKGESASYTAFNTLFYDHQDGGRPDSITQGNFIFRGNIWHVKDTEEGIIRFNWGAFDYSEGAGDSIYTYGVVTISDVFYLNSSELFIDLMEAEKTNLNISIIGSANSYNTRERSSSDDAKPLSLQSNTNIYVYDFDSLNNSLFALTHNTTQKVELGRVNAEALRLSQFDLNTRLYKLAGLSIIIDVSIDYIDRTGQEKHSQWTMVNPAFFNANIWADKKGSSIASDNLYGLGGADTFLVKPTGYDEMEFMISGYEFRLINFDVAQSAVITMVCRPFQEEIPAGSFGVKSDWLEEYVEISGDYELPESSTVGGLDVYARIQVKIGSGAPKDVVVPDFVGQIYHDTASSPVKIWEACGATDSNWIMYFPATSDQFHVVSVDTITSTNYNTTPPQIFRDWDENAIKTIDIDVYSFDNDTLTVNEEGTYRINAKNMFSGNPVFNDGQLFSLLRVNSIPSHSPEIYGISNVTNPNNEVLSTDLHQVIELTAGDKLFIMTEQKGNAGTVLQNSRAAFWHVEKIKN